MRLLCVMSPRRDTRFHLEVTPARYEALPTTPVDPPQRSTLVPVQGENDCTVGEVVEGATLIGFPGDDVCVAAT